MEKYYVLNENKVAVPISDLKEWGLMFDDTRSRTVKKTELKKHGASVSTVFMGLDHQWGDGPSLLFETMVFGGHWDEYLQRYSTWDKAQEGHDDVVSKIKEGIRAPEEY